jgi:predicted MFS family arabinose efflux permease
MCFLLNTLSYVAVIISLTMIRVRPGSQAPAMAEKDGSSALRAGFDYARRRPEVGRILTLVGVVSAVAVPYRSFLPAMARGVLDVGAWRYGLLMAAAGVGAGTGGLVLAGLKISRNVYRRLLPLALLIFSVSLGGFALAREYYLALVLLTAVGIGGILYFNCSNTLIQLSVDDTYRGRVMSFYTLMHQGTATFGSLAIGVLSDRYGTPVGLLAGAVVCLAAGGVWVASSREF